LRKSRIPHQKDCDDDDDDDDININKKTNDSFPYFYSFLIFDVTCQARSE